MFALLSCLVEQGRWLKPHLVVGSYFDCRRWTCRVTQPIQRTPLWPAAWLSAVDKSRSSKSVELQRVWEMYDDPLQFMAVPEALWRDDASRWEDVSDAWIVWSAETMTALADACCFAGGPVPDRGLVPGRSVAQFMVVRLGGPQVRKARNIVAGPLDGGDVLMYRDSSIASLLDPSRKLKAVLGCLGWHDQDRSFAVSVNRTYCAVRGILRVGPICPGRLVEALVSSMEWLKGFIEESVISFIGLWFIEGMRRSVVGEVGYVRIHWFIHASGGGLIWCFLLPAFSVSLITLLGFWGFGSSG